jgi:hypothetical protein
MDIFIYFSPIMSYSRFIFNKFLLLKKLKKVDILLYLLFYQTIESSPRGEDHGEEDVTLSQLVISYSFLLFKFELPTDLLLI